MRFLAREFQEIGTSTPERLQSSARIPSVVHIFHSEAQLLDNWRCLADAAVEIVPRVARGAVVHHLASGQARRSSEPRGSRTRSDKQRQHLS